MVYTNICGFKCNDINVENIIIIGDLKYFNDSKIATYDYFTKYIHYRGFSAILTNYGLTKQQALDSANKQYSKNIPFSNGIKPFVLVVNLKGDLKWCVLNGNLMSNDVKIEKYTEQ